MTNKIYTKTFIAKMRLELEQLDNGIGEAEQSMFQITQLQNHYIEGKSKELEDRTGEQSTTSSFDNHLDRMWTHITDMYSLKNDLLEWLSELES